MQLRINLHFVLCQPECLIHCQPLDPITETKETCRSSYDPGGILCWIGLCCVGVDASGAFAVLIQSSFSAFRSSFSGSVLFTLLTVLCPTPILRIVVLCHIFNVRNVAGYVIACTGICLSTVDNSKTRFSPAEHTSHPTKTRHEVLWIATICDRIDYCRLHLILLVLRSSWSIRAP